MARVVLENVCKDFGKVQAVSCFFLDVEDREFCVLLGPSGCGKSTTLHMIAGLEEMNEGNIYIGDKRVNELGPRDRDIAMVFQDYALYPHMTVRQNMAFGLKLRKFPRPEIERRVQEAAEILGIKELLDRKPRELSGGQRQRVALGRAIAWGGRIVILDEPTAALGVKETSKVLTLIKQLKEHGVSIIVISHNMRDVFDISDQIIVLRGGRRVGSRMRSETDMDEIVKLITGALES